MINANPNLQTEFDLIGFSQGTIISRYIIQNCNLTGSVRNFVSFGGPLNGEASEQCNWYDLYCFANRLYFNFAVFTQDYKDNWAPSGYARTPWNYQGYLENSSFLAEANNEVNYSAERRQKFLNLNRAMFIKWDAETVIKPAESSWWGEYNSGYEVLNRTQTELYHKDLIGIRTLENEGRAKFINIPGKHMEYTWEQIDKIIIPFLLGQ